MASTWGTSWLTSWGLAWDRVQAEPLPPSIGTGGGTGVTLRTRVETPPALLHMRARIRETDDICLAALSLGPNPRKQREAEFILLAD